MGEVKPTIVIPTRLHFVDTVDWREVPAPCQPELGLCDTLEVPHILI